MCFFYLDPEPDPYWKKLDPDPYKTYTDPEHWFITLQMPHANEIADNKMLFINKYRTFLLNFLLESLTFETLTTAPAYNMQT